MSGDAVVAGRLEIPVESNTKGFKERLKRAVEKAAEGVEAPVGVKINNPGFKKRLQTAIDEASVGVNAKIGVTIKTKDLKAKLQAAAKAAGPVSVDADLKKFSTTVKRHLDDVAKQKVTVAVQADQKGLTSTLAQIKAKIKGANLDATPKIGGGGKGKDGGGFKMPDFSGSRGARSAFMPIGILALSSVIQPAIAAIVGSLGGLAAAAGAAASAVNLLGAAGGPLFTLVAGFSAVKIAFGAISGPIKDVPKNLRFVREEADALQGSWDKMKTAVATSFWTPLKGQITSTGKVAIPILKEGLSGVAEELGKTGKATALWMKSPMFKAQSGQIFAAMKSQASGFGDAILGALKGVVNITDAAGPVLLKFSGVMTNFGKWSASIGDTPEKQRKLGQAFEYAWQKASQLWDMTKNLGATIKAMFGAGRESGDRLLGSLQDVVGEWRKWATSTEGQERIKKWFDNVEPIARAAGRLIVDLGKAVARLAEDSTTAGLLEQIRTELLPSLETFLRNLGTTLGPAVITFVTNVLEVLTQMSAAGSPLGQGLSVINTLIGGLADIFKAHPELAKNVGILLGALLGFRALTFFGGLIPGIAQLFKFVQGGGKAAFVGAAGGLALFSGALSGLPGPLQGAIAAISTLLTLVPSFKNWGENGKGLGTFTTHINAMGDAAKKKKGDVSGFAGSLKTLQGAMGYGAGAVGGGLKSAASGLMGMLGGPWGIALAGAATAVGAFAQAQADAKADVDALMATVDKQTGSFTEASKKQINDKLGFDVNSDDLKRLSGAGIDVAGAANAVLGDDAGFEAYKQTLIDLRKETMTTDGVTTKAANGMISALGFQREAYAGVREQLAATNILMGESGDKAAGSAPGVKSLADKMRELRPSATEVADAMERLAGITLSGREANRRAAEATEALNASLAKNKGAHGNATAAGRENEAALDAYASAQMGAIKANAEGGASASALRDQLEKARAKVIASARAMNYSQTEAEQLATDMGLTGAAADGMAAKVAAIKGKAVTVTVTDRVTAMVGFIQGQIDSLTGKTVSIHTVYTQSGHVGAQHAQMGKKKGDVYFGEADGGIIRYLADGGVLRALGRKVKSFANGTERHIAQIARGGEYRVWAEDETGGEAYIPLAPSKRGRSMDILAQVADEFGMALTPALSGAASAAGAAYASTSRSRFVEPAAAGGAREVTFGEGAIQIINPAPEPASKSVVSTLRSVGDFGLFGEDD